MEVSDRSGSEDTHLRMSKKIAQLTRVIYHLHTANDNRLFELSSLQRHYESEIEHVTEIFSLSLFFTFSLYHLERNSALFSPFLSMMILRAFLRRG